MPKKAVNKDTVKEKKKRDKEREKTKTKAKKKKTTQTPAKAPMKRKTPAKKATKAATAVLGTPDKVKRTSNCKFYVDEDNSREEYDSIEGEDKMVCCVTVVKYTACCNIHIA